MVGVKSTQDALNRIAVGVSVPEGLFNQACFAVYTYEVELYASNNRQYDTSSRRQGGAPKQY